MDYIKKYNEKYHPKIGIIRGYNEAAVKERNRRAKEKKIYFQKLLYRKMADAIEEWREGFEFFDAATGVVYWVKVIVICCVFDLPALSEATGLVSYMMHDDEIVVYLNNAFGHRA
jgi:hypothetical protein